MAELRDPSFIMEAADVESKTSGKSFDDLYTIGELLGRGVFSEVKSGHHKETQHQYAIKIIHKPEMEEFDKRCLTQEIASLSALNHPNVITLHDVFDGKDTVHMILEIVQGGELLGRLIQKKNYTEREARDVCKSVMEAMHHCHSHKIAHRDLKAENLLLASLDDDTTVKIADFGFAKYCPHDEALKTQCGSAQHVAPEILKNESYGTKVDMWALGVIHYTLIGGRPPFWAQEGNQATFQKILKRDFKFTDDLWGHVSDDCKDMIRNLLLLDPKQRWSADDVLKCKWIAESDASELDQHSLAVNQEKLKLVGAAKEKVKAATYALIGLNRLQFDGQIPDDDEIIEEIIEEETVVSEFEEEEVIEEIVEEEEEEEEEFVGIVTRDLYSAFKIADCECEPKRRDYFALAQTTGDFLAQVLKNKYGDDFDEVEMTLRKSLYNAGKPTDEYQVYVEWDITAHFACDPEKVPSRREVCTSLVMANLENYIIEYLHPLESCPGAGSPKVPSMFQQTTGVFFGHVAF
ncbi:MAP kinase-activated protein kinase 2 (Fragment) [Seminavis robusta]|uniref:MAP kinase-activated protein kinase 2 n=1 Tax=Seminavis robusta TaxID=568900 RepID=A0A9N8DGH0_9STRA